MTSVRDILLSILNFSAAEFGAAPGVDTSARLDALLFGEFVGIAINAPTQVEASQKIPVAIAYRFDLGRGWDVPMHRNIALVSTNMADGTVYLSNPFQKPHVHRRHDEFAPMDRGERPPADQLTGITGQVDWTDTERTQLPVAPGSWTFGVLYHDWPSNIVMTKVQGDVASAEARPIHPAPNAGSGFPTFIQRGSSPVVAGYGADFEVRVLEEGGVQKFYITGSFGLKMPPWMISDGTVIDQGLEKQIRATVPISLIVMPLHKKAKKFDLVAPVYGQTVDAGADVTGYFTLDVLEGSGERLEPGQYATYISVDGGIFGPKMVEVAAPQ